MRYDKRARGVLVSFLLAIVLFPVFSGDPTMNGIVLPGSIAYSPDSGGVSTGVITIKNNNWDKPFCVVFTAPSTLGAGIAYDLKKPSGTPTYILSKTGWAVTATEVLGDTFVGSDTNSSTKNLGYAVVAYPGSFPVPGSYTVTLTASLYKSSLPNAGTFVQSKTLNITVVVGNRFDISIVAVDDPFSLSATSAALAFGVLQEGDIRLIDAIARSNTPYSISISSANGGAMRNADPLDTCAVAYAFSANGQAISLASPAQITANADATGPTGTRYQLSFTILPFTELLSEGTYGDTLTLTISAP